MHQLSATGKSHLLIKFYKLYYWELLFYTTWKHWGNVLSMSINLSPTGFLSLYTYKKGSKLHSVVLKGVKKEHFSVITLIVRTLQRSKHGLSAHCLSSAVQSERKPIDVVPREKHANCAASTQKIYIRKDLNSPLIATPTFISDTETDGSRSVCIR